MSCEWLTGVMKCFCLMAVFLATIPGLTDGATDCDVQSLSRLDIVPCTPHEDTTFPKPNQYGIYHTRIRAESLNSFPECQYRNPNAVFQQSGKSKGYQKLIDITTRGTEELRFIYSPGFELIPQENYPSQVLVNYSIQCGEGDRAFLYITELDLRENCDGVCVDYVALDRKKFGWTESCGRHVYNNMLSLNTNQFNVIFRSSTNEVVNSGFRALVVCFKPFEGKKEGCTEISMAVASTVINAIYDTIRHPKEEILEAEPLPHEEKLLTDADGDGAKLTDAHAENEKFFEAPKLSDNAIIEAYRNENSCNPVLSSLFKATLTIAEREDPAHYAELLEKLCRNCY